MRSNHNNPRLDNKALVHNGLSDRALRAKEDANRRIVPGRWRPVKLARHEPGFFNLSQFLEQSRMPSQRANSKRLQLTRLHEEPERHACIAHISNHPRSKVAGGRYSDLSASKTGVGGPTPSHPEPQQDRRQSNREAP